MRRWVAEIPNDGLIRFRSFMNAERLLPTTPETLKSVMSDNSYDYEKPANVRKFLGKILGEGLVISEGGLHKFQRKHALPAFQVQHIRELYPVFWGKSVELVNAMATEIAVAAEEMVSVSSQDSVQGQQTHNSRMQTRAETKKRLVSIRLSISENGLLESL